LNESFLALGRELDIVEAKTPEDVYKSEGDASTSHANSARGNLAATFVNAFINAGGDG
jgi:26S proteasome regulatory subunit N1